ncbi:tRNA1(Val) (adenine(37)-N6)-methyltransferase [Yoonia litorea]|uniref:tRNA1(Val) A37 N6-methylase TrmN6 n=1 Tax=Yoonia litorea TaxID=1123755 RepID=A0A1I6N2L2_9RHOB|nr:methyltransferase [Yoonia litorea]SFS22183.1 tRNA1(Val) A37 N6-methylase TrmN6 [Yoonia litorea]
MQRSTLAVTENLTCDDFLGGKLRIWQPRSGYRAGVDPVLLAAAVPAQAGDTVLELGCGVGVASLCVMTRVAGVNVTGVEVQADYAALALRNAGENDLPFDVVQADLRALPYEVRQQQFTHVIMNPPFFDRTRGTAAQDPGRDMALGGQTSLADWLDIGIKRLAPQGYLTVIQRIDRLPEVLAHIEGRIGAIVVEPIAGRATKAPENFILQGRHSGKTPFRLARPLVMQRGDRHESDREDYTAQVSGILRDGDALPLFD